MENCIVFIFLNEIWKKPVFDAEAKLSLLDSLQSAISNRGCVAVVQTGFDDFSS